MTEVHDFLRLTMLPKIGPTRGRALAARFDTWGDLCHAGLRDLMHVPGIHLGLARALLETVRSQQARDRIEAGVLRSITLAAQKNARLITPSDAAFPEPLKHLYDAPLFLFMQGEFRHGDGRSAAIVGTRAPTEYGRRVAEQLGREFAIAGVSTASGLAIGIDTAAHQATLAQGGRTIAVLGSGLANLYPPSNRLLAERIAENGCLLSEFLMDAAPDAPNFPRRNRIISGITLATIVVESGAKGGAIITARMALDQNRDVFAVPGSIYSPASIGTNMLLRRGNARVCTRAQDVFDEVPMLAGTARKQRAPAVQLTLTEQSIVGVLSDTPVHIDEIAVQTGLGPAELLVQMLALEFKGIVRQHPGKHFTRE